MSLDDDNNEINNSKKIFLINILKNLRMKKILFCSALAAVALASCSSDDFMGDTSGSTPSSANSAIKFDGNAGKITRATSNTGSAAQMLDGQFKIYGVKKTNNEMFHNVFVDYSVWDVEAKNTTSNTKGWEYVGTKDAANLGTGQIKLTQNQTIKYWDYSASEYRFVAGSPISAFKYTISMDGTTGTDILSATVTGLAGHINANNTETALKTDPVYVAAPVKVEKNGYQKPVQFTFIRQQSMVRVGLYETIPGYSITEIKFYEADGTTATSSNIILTSSTADYFVGGSNLTGTVTYNWTPTPSYTYAYNETGLLKSKNWYAGKLESNHPLATTSSEPLYGTDKDMSTTGYFTVLPTPSATTASAILIKCDYTLTADDQSGETIKVTGATAAIPAAYSKWETNTRYTYLFKISDKTNGTTGNPNDPNEPKDPAGLYPITFDAVVTEMADKTQGTTTTVATPSITTHQEGSVTANGIEYKSGKPIDVTVTDANGTAQTLSKDGSAVGNVAVYKFTSAITEAEVQVKGTTGVGVTEVTNGSVADNVYTFTPDGEGYYAIQYLTTAADGDKPAAYTYKVVYVAGTTK